MKGLIPALLALAVASPTLAEDITYARHIRPLWEDKCERCHGASAPTYAVFMKDKRTYELDDKGPRMDTYESLMFFVNGAEEAGALMRRLDDGSNTKDGQPGSMYRHLGRGEQRRANLEIFKQWIGEGAWLVKQTGEFSKDDLQKIKAER